MRFARKTTASTIWLMLKLVTFVAHIESISRPWKFRTKLGAIQGQLSACTDRRTVRAVKFKV